MMANLHEAFSAAEGILSDSHDLRFIPHSKPRWPCVAISVVSVDGVELLAQPMLSLKPTHPRTVAPGSPGRTLFIAP